MSKAGLSVVLFLGLVIIVGLAVLIFIPTRPAAAPTTPQISTTTAPASLDDTIMVTVPLPNVLIEPPLQVAGKARGSWFFEAHAPAELLDASGTVLAQGSVQAQGDWESTNYVPFTLTLTFPAPTTTTGTLILKNDNPSGNPATQKELDIPIRFR